uniref:Serine peptidase inhibitor, Kunitz type 4 n=1 Tax=Sciurus vulgaris TaxID=55149 RepID=A0A8D2AHG9_SCIVU
MKPAMLGFLLGLFIFCSLTTPLLGGMNKVFDVLCRNYRDPCVMDKNPGSCFDVFPRFFYNKSIKQCQSFLYTGCDGNLNNYLLKIECQVACVPGFKT